MAEVTFSWMGASHAACSATRGRNVCTNEIVIPSDTPPTNARGRSTSRPSAAAVTATTTRLKKSGAASVLNRGAIKTPANPANRLDSAHANAATPSERTPASSVRRGLSTVARICSPSGLNRKSAPRPAMATAAITIDVSSFRLNE